MDKYTVIRRVIRVVSKYYGVDPFTSYRGRDYCECRYAIWYCLRYKIDNPLGVSAIAKRFDRDHTTVCQGIIRFNDLLNQESAIRYKMQCIEAQLISNLRNVPLNLFMEKRSLTVKDGKVYPRKERTAA